MNANEVIANRGNELAGKKLLHPNDDINKSQSSNDTFPTAMHIAAVIAIEDQLFPAMDKLTATFRRLEEENEGIVKSGRTHLQDATPIAFSQEISGWRAMIEKTKKQIDTYAAVAEGTCARRHRRRYRTQRPEGLRRQK